MRSLSFRSLYFRSLSHQEFVKSGVSHLEIGYFRSLTSWSFFYTEVIKTWFLLYLWNFRSLSYQEFVWSGSFKKCNFSYPSYLSIIFYYTPPSWKLEFLCWIFFRWNIFCTKIQGGQNVRIVRIVRILFFLALKLYGLYGFFFKLYGLYGFLAWKNTFPPLFLTHFSKFAWKFSKKILSKRSWFNLFSAF